jgi:mono/diheme cytochrome c family protein
MARRVGGSILLPSGLVAAAVLLAGGCRGGADGGLEPGVMDASIVPAAVLAPSPALLDIGGQAYEKHCAACHGANGDGQGDAAYLLYPKPRDFTRGPFRLVSTWEGAPTDEDLFRTISRGMPGSAMPSWGHLPEETRWGLVYTVKGFVERPWEVPPPAEPPVPGDSGRGPIQVPPEPAFDDAARQRAATLYREGCAPCHGATGRGDGRREQIDAQGFPVRPRDLTAGIFKGSPEPEQVYRRIVAGLPGSPMPQSGYLHGQDAWDLAHLVLSLSSPEQRDRAAMKRFRIVAGRVDDLPSHPDSEAWRVAAAVDLHLMPLWWRNQRPESITVKALHDGRELAMLLVWPDATQDDRTIRPQDFRDAAAVQFALDREPPFFAMGQRGAGVNIWMWKAERQADLRPAFQDLEKEYPNIGIDSYPNLERSPLEQPMRHALTLESDPAFITAWGAGNIVANPLRESPVEDLAAEGFGTLRARPPVDPAVTSSGVHAMGSYRVQFRRALAGAGAGGVRLGPGDRTAVAFAVWDGEFGDRDGRKSVTIWQELYLAFEATPPAAAPPGRAARAGL